MRLRMKPAPKVPNYRLTLGRRQSPLSHSALHSRPVNFSESNFDSVGSQWTVTIGETLPVGKTLTDGLVAARVGRRLRRQTIGRITPADDSHKQGGERRHSPHRL